MKVTIIKIFILLRIFMMEADVHMHKFDPLKNRNGTLFIFFNTPQKVIYNF